MPPSDEEIRLYYELTADDHQLTYTYPWARERMARTKALLAPELPVERMLDVGCGLGHYSVYAAENGAQAVVGVDIAQGALDQATPHERVTYLRRSWSDGLTDLGHFDLCLASESLEHAVDPWKVMRMLQSMCDRFVITVPDNWETLGFTPAGYGHLHVFNKQTARTLLTYAESCESDGRWLYLVGT